MRTVSLVILAAGSSTRFGRPKQWEPVGPRGEAILDITLRDALAAGCDEARIVVRPAHEAMALERYKGNKLVRVVVQHEPLGTGHAALVGMGQAAGTFIVANADDLYGRESMRIAVGHAREGAAEEHAMVAFGLGCTLSLNGPVSRALCTKGRHHLRAIEEVRGIERAPDGAIRSADGRAWPSSAPVSMNLWVLRGSFSTHFLALVRDIPMTAGEELGLPCIVRALMAAGHAFRVLRTPDAWHGLTFADDADLVRRILAQRP